MRKSIIALLTVFSMLLSACTSCFAGILPDLQSNHMESAISLHMILGWSAPEAVLQEDGSYQFDYENVSLMNYSDFGSALAQEGYTLTSSDTTDNGFVTAVVSDGTNQFTVKFDPSYNTMSVIYPEGMVIGQYIEDNPYVIDRSQASILPEIPQAISLHGVTSKSYYDKTYPEDGGTQFNYIDVSYDLYEQFSTKLEEAGFTLESSQTLIDGTSRAVVTDGAVSLTIDYNMDSGNASVLYPAGVFARPCVKYDDYTALKDGDSVSLTEDVSMTVTGWEEVDSYTDYYYDNNWIPSKYYDEEHISAYGEHQIVVSFLVDYNRPDSRSVNGLFQDMEVKYGVYNPVSFDRGEETGERSIYDDSDNEVSGTEQFTFSVGFSLNDSEMENLDKVALSFEDADGTNRYVYYLQSPE